MDELQASGETRADRPLALDRPANIGYAGTFSDGRPDAFGIERSADGAAVVQIAVNYLLCGGWPRTFTLVLSDAIPVVANRFSVTDVPVVIPNDPMHGLDIDGVFFDADGDGTPEQALGGLSFVTGSSRCNVRWWATAVAADDDRDGWSDAAERRLGSEYRNYTPTVQGEDSTPEHHLVPITPRASPGVCQDFLDNDVDQTQDQHETDGPDLDPFRDCEAVLSGYLPLVSRTP